MKDFSRTNLPRLYAIRVLFWMHFFAAVLVPFYTQWGGITLAQVFYLNAWFFFWNFILEVPTGTVADVFGRKASLALGSVVGVAACLVYASRPSLPVFMAAEVLFAVAYTLHSGADEALAYDSLAADGRAAEARRVMSRMESFKLAGIVSSALIGGLIAARFGLRAPMVAYVVPSALAVGLALTLREPPASDPSASQRPRYVEVLKDGFRYFFQHPVLLLLTADMVVTNAMVWALIWLFQPLLGRAGLPVPLFGTVHVGMCLGQIVLLSNMDAVERLAGSKLRFLFAGTLVAGAAFLVLAASRSLAVVIPALIVAATFGLSRVPVFSAYLNKHIPSDKRATVLSISSMLRTLSIVVMNPISGWLAQRSLSLAMAALGAGLIALPLLSRIEERHLAD